VPTKTLPGSTILVRHGKNDRRREVGMDASGWSALEPWLAERAKLPVGPLFCVIVGPTRGHRWSESAARLELHRTAIEAGVRRRFAPHQLRHAHAVELLHEGIPLPLIQRQLGHGHLSTTGQGSSRGAVPALPPVRFPDPPSEPVTWNST
jgi:site-specific recombinase XerD